MRQNAVEEKKSVEKSVFRRNKEEKKGNCAQAGYYLFMAKFQTKIKIYSFALETFSVIFCMQKEISICRLFPSNENSSYYENNP